MQCEYIGSSYGGFPCCPSLLNANSVVLDCGVGEDITFALGLMERVGCKIELFDFTPDSIAWFNESYKDVPGIIYNEYGISDHDGLLEVYDYGGGISRRSSWMGYEANEIHPVKRIHTIMREKNIDRIDLLKLDVEGEEYKIIPQLLEDGIFPEQLCVEEHRRFLDDVHQHNAVFDSLLEHYELVGRTQQEFCFLKKA